MPAFPKLVAKRLLLAQTALVAAPCAGVARCGDPGDSLRTRLLRPGPHRLCIRYRRCRAFSVTDAQDGSHVLIDGVLHGIHHIVGINEMQTGAPRQNRRPREIAVRLLLIARTGSGVLGIRNQRGGQLRIA